MTNPSSPGAGTRAAEADPAPPWDASWWGSAAVGSLQLPTGQ
jgi:hypothetical protein